MGNYRETFTIARGNEINGLSRTAYEVADKYQIDCKIDREVIKTGWFSKRYEYHITYSGDNDKVMKAIDDMREKCEEYNNRINALIRTSCGSGW